MLEISTRMANFDELVESLSNTIFQRKPLVAALRFKICKFAGIIRTCITRLSYFRIRRRLRQGMSFGSLRLRLSSVAMRQTKHDSTLRHIEENGTVA